MQTFYLWKLPPSPFSNKKRPAMKWRGLLHYLQIGNLISWFGSLVPSVVVIKHKQGQFLHQKSPAGLRYSNQQPSDHKFTDTNQGSKLTQIFSPRATPSIIWNTDNKHARTHSCTLPSHQGHIALCVAASAEAPDKQRLIKAEPWALPRILLDSLHVLSGNPVQHHW